MSMTLPQGFGFVLAEIHANVVVDRALDFGTSGMFLLTAIDAAHKDFTYRMFLEFNAVSNAGVTVDARSTSTEAGILSRLPIIPAQEGTFATLRFNNLSATAQAAGTFAAVVSFWEYDLEQIRHFAAHMATNVVGR